MQAWKGDVTKLSNDTYSLTNKCFNNELYPCQCLELGYLIRYQPGNNPSAGNQRTTNLSQCPEKAPSVIYSLVSQFKVYLPCFFKHN